MKKLSARVVVKVAPKTAKERYDAYILSPEWEWRKVQFYRRFHRVCAACRATIDVDLHHMNYQRLGREWDIDIIPLCRTCHTFIHDRFERTYRKMGWTLELATYRFIAGRLARRRVSNRGLGGIAV